MSFILEGVDYSQHSPNTPSAASLLAAGKHFVCCYIVNDGDWRANTASEIAALVAGGIDIIGNWEGTANRMQAGYAAGVADAQNAQANLVRLGLPPNQPIYFSADWDATPEDQTAIDAYLQGVASVIGLARTGVYGGYWVVSRCAANKTASFFWQTTAWSGGQLFNGAHLYQYQYNQYIEGVNVDFTQALQEHYGQRSDFVAPPVPLATGATASVTATALNLRSAAGLAASVAASLATGAVVTILGAPQEADGYTWYQVRDASGATGWCAGEYLVATAAPTAPTPTTTTTAAPKGVPSGPYAKPVPVPGPVQDQTYHGTPMFAFVHQMETVRDGVKCLAAGSPHAAETRAPLPKGTKINTAYLYRSATDGNAYVIGTGGSRVLLSDLAPVVSAEPASTTTTTTTAAPAPVTAGAVTTVSTPSGK